MADIKFNVIEKPDASGFFIYKTGNTTISPMAFLTITNNYGDEFTQYNFSNDDITAFNTTANGVEIKAVDIGSAELKDGIYVFELLSGQGNGSANSGTHTEGFAAIITSKVIKDALSYRLRMTKAVKDYIQEKVLILNNLAFAAHTGNPASFSVNLEILQRME